MLTKRFYKREKEERRRRRERDNPGRRQEGLVLYLRPGLITFQHLYKGRKEP
jgi:hypothetical protein